MESDRTYIARSAGPSAAIESGVGPKIASHLLSRLIMSPSGSVKKRKASEKDYAPSHGTVDIESMTDQQRKDFLAALRREEKRREKAGELVRILSRDIR